MKLFNHVGLDPIEMSAEMVDGKRVYLTPEGFKFPSVTTVISNNKEKMAGIARWRERVGEEKANNISSRSTNRGTKYHSIVEDYLNNKLDLKNYRKFPLPVLMFQHSRETLDRINNIYLQEAALYSRHLELAGRVDCIAEFDGELSIIDFKTSSRQKSEDKIQNYFMQCAAYAVMFEERTGIPVPRIAIVITVDSDHPQVFVKKRNDYIGMFKTYLEMFDNQSVFS